MHLAPRTELLGAVEGGAFAQPHFLVRRPDGAVVQVSALIYFALEALATTEEAGPGEVARHVTQRCGRTLTPEGAEFLLREKIEPLGLVARLDAAGDASLAGLAHGGGAGPPARGESRGAAPTEILGLRLRARVLPERAYRAATRAGAPLFRPPVVVAVLIVLAASDAWGGAHLGPLVVRGFRQVMASPFLLLAMFLALTASAAFHELGHASAARYDGARSGVMGVGIYLVWPVFFTDVTDTYRLSRRGRLRTDLGGVYFHAIASLAALGCYLGTGSLAALAIAAMIQLTALYQFLPFVRFDGYYILADLIGVPNLFAYTKDVLRSLVRRSDGRGHGGGGRLAALKPTARFAIRAWVLTSLAVLAGDLTLMAVLAPRLVPRLWATGRLDAVALARSAGRLDAVRALDAFFGLLIVTVMLAGLVFMVVRVAARVLPVVARVRPASPLRWLVAVANRSRRSRRAFTLGATVAVAVAAGGFSLLLAHRLGSGRPLPPVEEPSGPVGQAPPATSSAAPPTAPAPPTAERVGPVGDSHRLPGRAPRSAAPPRAPSATGPHQAAPLTTSPVTSSTAPHVRHRPHRRRAVSHTATALAGRPVRPARAHHRRDHGSPAGIDRSRRPSGDTAASPARRPTRRVRRTGSSRGVTAAAAPRATTPSASGPAGAPKAGTASSPSSMPTTTGAAGTNGTATATTAGASAPSTTATSASQPPTVSPVTTTTSVPATTIPASTTPVATSASATASTTTSTPTAAPAGTTASPPTTATTPTTTTTTGTTAPPAPTTTPSASPGPVTTAPTPSGSTTSTTSPGTIAVTVTLPLSLFGG